ncbi:MAG: type II toxin-antitoxin system VapC family toxin [Candidatus Bathyarchaeota archaeon]|nr:type II toxin-antitoxin system VapC family toxin [Candidatus Bathyarchaeota archaeon]
MNLLDTGIVIEMLKEKEQRQGIISIITLAEILRGINTQKRPAIRRLLEESFAVINLDTTAVEKYCDLYSNLKKQGTLLPDADLFIAAAAIKHDLTLETTDERFQRLKTRRLKTQII